VVSRLTLSMEQPGHRRAESRNYWIVTLALPKSPSGAPALSVADSTNSRGLGVNESMNCSP